MKFSLPPQNVHFRPWLQIKRECKGRITMCWLIGKRRGKQRHRKGEFVQEVFSAAGQMVHYHSFHCRSEASGQHILILIITLTWSLRKSRTTSWAGRMWWWKNQWPLLRYTKILLGFCFEEKENEFWVVPLSHVY